MLIQHQSANGAWCLWECKLIDCGVSGIVEFPLVDNWSLPSLVGVGIGKAEFHIFPISSCILEYLCLVLQLKGIGNGFDAHIVFGVPTGIGYEIIDLEGGWTGAGCFYTDSDLSFRFIVALLERIQLVPKGLNFLVICRNLRIDLQFLVGNFGVFGIKKIQGCF